jgi:hypothetical protein
MKCEEIQARLSDYLDNSLATAARAALEEHLAACALCREESVLLGEAMRQIAALPVVEPPLGFSQRVMAHVREFETQPGFWQRLILAPRQKIPLQAGAVVIIAILGVYLLQKEETQEQLKPLTQAQIAGPIKDDNALSTQVPATPVPGHEDRVLAKLSAGQTTRKSAPSPVPQGQSAARRPGARSEDMETPKAEESVPSTAAARTAVPRLGTLSEDRRASVPLGETKERSAPTISGTTAASSASTQAGATSVTLSFPSESENTLRLAPAAVEPFADYELIVRRHSRPRTEPRGDSAAAARKAEVSPAAAERPAAPRAIDRLMAAIPDRTRQQTIWVNVPQNQYEHFKNELQSLGTLESEHLVPTLRSQPASHSDGIIRVKLTALPPAETGAVNPSPGQ